MPEVVGPLSHVTVIWSMIAAGALLLGFIHLARWGADRSGASIAFVLTAFGFAGIAGTELWAMQTGSAQAWGYAVRWCHLPIFLTNLGVAAFVHLYLGTGRTWLATSAIALRTVITAWNFAVWPNFNFVQIQSVARIPFLGDTVTAVNHAVTNPWQFLATLQTVLLALYVIDAAASLWRDGTGEQRRRAVTIGASMLLFLLIAAASTQLVIYSVWVMPTLMTPAFLFPLTAMAYESSRDTLRAARLARDLGESERRLELAAGAADLGLWEWDNRTNRVWTTPKAREIFGLGDDGADDFRRWLDRVHPGDVPRLMREMGGALETGAQCSAEFRVLANGGAPRWVAAVGSAQAGEPGRPARIRGVLRDISVQRRAQDEALELRRELAHAGRVSLLGQLASSLAHELSQPLGAILRNAEAAGMLLQSQAPDHEELKAIVTDILRDDSRARDVVERLRSMLKRRQVDFQQIAPDSLIQDVVALVRADAASRDIALELAPAPPLPALSGDRVQLSQVILNLALNAMDAVAQNQSIRRSVALAARPGPDGKVEICVSDTGPGIPPELAKKVFEPFYTTKPTGLGMGLAISRTIAEAHGGSLTLENNADGGMTFRLTLPASIPIAA